MSESRAVIDLWRLAPGEGYSFRISEALTLNSKIITNRTCILNEPFYDASRMFVFPRGMKSTLTPLSIFSFPQWNPSTNQFLALEQTDEITNNWWCRIYRIKFHSGQNRKGDKVLNLDKLTYSGNLDNLISVQDNENYSFIQGDIGDKILTQKSFPNSVRTPWLISPQRRMLIGRW